MEIRRYTQLLNRRKWVVILALAATLFAVGLGTYRMTPVYSASALVRIAEGRGGTVSYTELNYAERLINTSVEMLKSRPFLEKVIQQLNLQDPPEALSRRIKVEALANTELIKITAESSNPAEAASIANALAASLVEQRDQVYAGQGTSGAETLKEQLAAAETQLSQTRASLAQMSQPQPNATPSVAVSAAIADLAARVKFQEQTYAAILGEYDRARIDQATRGDSISITQTAVEPRLPSRPVPQLYLAVALVVGLVAGVGLAFLFERLDTTIHEAADLETIAQASLLGVVPIFKGQERGEKGAISLDNADGSAVAEAFRLLGTNLLPLLSTRSPQSSAGAKTLLIASADPGVGRSTVAANLAVAIAGMGLRVAVVDADAGQPSLHRAFRLSEEAEPEDPALNHPEESGVMRDTTIPGVKVLTGSSWARSCPPPLNHWRAQGLIERLSEDVDVVLLDSPPMLASADAAVLAPLVDGVLLVAARGHSTTKSVEEAVVRLANAGGRTLGVVLNRVQVGPEIRRLHLGRSVVPEQPKTGSSKKYGYLWMKRGMDVALSVLGLVLLSPVLLVIAVLIKLDSPGPVIFAQERMGFDWRHRKATSFRLYKFRSMFQNADETAHQQFIQDWIRGRKGPDQYKELVKMTHDPRVTPVGQFLRKTSLDELPQLWNVLKGDMSLVGPRPVPLYEVAEYEPWHRQRLQATPGITCLWQVSGRGHTDIDEMVRMDMEYIERQSFWLDLKVLLLTIPVVLTGRGAA